MKQNFFLRLLACAFICLLLSQARPLSAAPLLTLPQLLVKHRNAAATPAAQRDKTAHEIVYAISAGGLAGSMTTYEAPPHKSRMEMSLGPIVMTTGTDGRVTWEQDGAGNVRVLGGEELSERAADTGFSLENFDPAKNPAGTVVKLRPTLDAETNCYVLDVKPKNGSQQTVYLDAKTYLVKKTIEHKGGLTGVVSVLAYTLKDGTQVPSHLAIQYAGLPLVIDANLKSVSRLPVVTAAFFAPPTPTKDWQFLQPGPRQAATLAFSTDSNEIILPVTINGHTLRFLLDSGSGTAFITEGGAKVAGLTTQGDLPALGYGGAAATGLAADTTLDVGDAVRLSHLTLHVIKDPAITRLLSERGQVDGAVGYELFARLTVSINYAQKTLTLTDPLVMPPAQTTGSAVPIKLENRMPTVLASVDGKPLGRFLVDTGDAGAAHLYTQYAAANGLLPKAGDPQAVTRQGVGVGGQMTETLSPNHTLQIGGERVSGLTLSTIGGPGISQVSSSAGGIGNVFLSHFTVTFDYARGKMSLRPNPSLAKGSPPALQSALHPAPVRRGAFLRRPILGSNTEGREAQSISAPCRIRLPRIGAGGPLSAILVPTLLFDSDAPPMTLQTLLSKHLTALGGAAALGAIKNTKITSDVTTGGIKGVITTIYAAPDKEYEEDKLGILDNLQGYDGKTAWVRDTNGNVRDLAGEELKDLRVQLFFDTNSYVLPGRLPGTLTLRPRTEPETGNYIVDALPGGGKKSTVFFDPRTFMIVKEQHLDDDVLVTTTYSGYRLVDSTPFPFHTVTTNGNSRYDIVGQAVTIENNLSVADSLFAKPSGGKNFRFVTPGATTATVPFDLDDGEIGLAVKINGTSERVFLDSGAGGIALSQTTATALGLKSDGFLEVRGYGGSTDQHPVRIDTLEVPGAVQLSGVTGIAIELPDQLDSYFTQPVAGFIGYDLLSHFVVRIDYGRKKMTFIQPDTFRPALSDGAMLPLTLDSNLPTVQARIDALPSSQFLIDTGDADAAVRLFGPYIAKHALDRKYPHGVVAVGGGIGGVSRARRTRIGLLTVAGQTLRNIPADFSLDTKGGASLVNAGSLGSRLLSQFVVTFDYPHSRVFFAPGVPRPAFTSRTTGITLIETKDKSGRTHLAVADILPGAPALKTGLSDFDEVLSIDGQPAGQVGLAEARRRLSASIGPAPVLTVQSIVGKPRTVLAGLFDPLH